MLSPLSTLILCMDFLISNSYPNVGIHNDGRALNCVVITFISNAKKCDFFWTVLVSIAIKQAIETISTLWKYVASDVDAALIFLPKSYLKSYSKW